MLDLTSYDVYIFDCDGVILNSNELKSEAFRDALAGEPRDKVNDLVNYHKAMEVSRDMRSLNISMRLFILQKIKKLSVRKLL